jgi:hypothetical protein
VQSQVGHRGSSRNVDSQTGEHETPPWKLPSIALFFGVVAAMTDAASLVLVLHLVRKL